MSSRLLTSYLVAAGLALACATMSGTSVAQETRAAPAPTKPAKPARGHATSKPTKATPKATPKVGTGATPKDPPRTTEPPKAGRPAGDAPHQVVERESRIEFDERMVRGQSAAGSIYLFQRSPSDFKSIVVVPDSFRARTVEMLAPRASRAAHQGAP
jgi:hypothetical protein